jgi:hypothetical protein
MTRESFPPSIAPCRAFGRLRRRFLNLPSGLALELVLLEHAPHGRSRRLGGERRPRGEHGGELAEQSLFQLGHRRDASPATHGPSGRPAGRNQ